jgi:hypothetical protein
MKILRQTRNDLTADWLAWHKLLVAEDGFSMLSKHADFHGLDASIVQQFAADVNQRHEVGSLHPRAPISAIPKRHFRDPGFADAEQSFTRWRTDLHSFLAANRATIHALRVLVDFRVSAVAIPAGYIEVAEEVFRADGQGAGFTEVVLFE